MTKKVLILGGNGNGLYVATMINQAFKKKETNFFCVGFVNDLTNKIGDFNVVSNFSGIKRLINEGFYFVNAISINRNERRDFYDNLKIPSSQLATFVHNTAFISENVQIDRGVIIGPNVSINHGTIIKEGVRIMSGVSIGAGCKINEHVFISVNSCVADNVTICTGVHIGLSSLLGENIVIGRDSLIGMGSFIEKNISQNEIWAGSPAKFLKPRFK